MKHRLFTFTRVNTNGDLEELEHFGVEENAVSAMEKSVQKKLAYLEECGWDLNGDKISVERTVHMTIVYFGESKEVFQITERWIDIEMYIV